MSMDFWKSRLHAAGTIQDRSYKAATNQLGIYIILAIGLLLAAVVVQNNLVYTERNLVYVSSEPLLLPILVLMWVVALYLAINAAISAARERDRGTLEVLLYGPVDEASFLLGKFIAGFKLYLVALVIALVWANLVTWWLHLAFSFRLAGILLVSSGMAAAIIAFGLLTAVLGGRTRTAIVYFFLVVLLLGAIQIGYQVVSGIILATSPTENDPLLTIRSVLAGANSVLRWISPYSQLDAAVQATLEKDWSGLALAVALLVAQVGALLAAAVALLKRKGVRA